MPAAADLTPAYVLHYRRYRDTSLILDVFSRDLGKYSAVARGAHGPRNRFRGLLQPFVPVLISCFGKGELKTVQNIDYSRKPIALKGDRLLIGLYVNELLNRLVGKYDPMEELYQRYEDLLQQLEVAEDFEHLLRRFEIALLADLGYGISFGHEAMSGRRIEAQGRYLYDCEAGFKPVSAADGATVTFLGEHLLSIDANDYSQPDVRVAAKHIVRMAIHPLLAGRPLNSRILFARRSVE